MKLPFACAFAATALLAGCAADVARLHGMDTLKYGDYAGPPMDRFTSFHLDGWEAVGPNQVVIWTGVNDAYLLKVWDSCRDLQFVERIGISSTSHTISRLDSVRVGREHCPISEIRRIDVKRMTADRARLKAAG